MKARASKGKKPKPASLASQATAPRFKANSELARYVHPDERNGDHAAATAFMLSEADTTKQSAAYLSVNALELESIKIIAEYYRQTIQKSGGEVAICTHKVMQYVNAGRKAGAKIVEKDDGWDFVGSAGEEPAFVHSPTPSRSSGFQGSPSHCGVHFLRALDDLKQRSFARQMAKKPRFHKL